MPHALISVLLAIALVIGSFGADAQTAGPSAGQPQTAQALAGTKNEPPLQPGSAAGIRAAQGTADVDVWFISGLIVASIVAALLLADDDGESAGSTDADQ